MKNMYHRIFSIGIFTILTFYCAAQKLDCTVYYANSDKQEIIQIDEVHWQKNNELKRVDDKRLIPLNEIEKVLFEERIFVLKRVQIHKLMGNEGETQMGLGPVEILLLEQRILGTINFYVHTNWMFKSFFFVEKNGDIQELVKVKYEKAGKAGFKDKYKGILNLFMHDCQQINQGEIDATDLHLKPLERLVKKYNDSCGKLDYAAAVKKKKRHKFHVGPMIGYQTHEVKQIDPKLEYLKEVDFQPFIFGVAIKYPFLKRKNQLFGKVGFSTRPVLSFEGQSENSFYRGDAIHPVTGENFVRYDTIRWDTSYKAFYHSWEVSFEYQINVGSKHIKPYVEVGASFRNLGKMINNTKTHSIISGPWRNDVDIERIVKKEAYPINVGSYFVKAGLVFYQFQLGFGYYWGPGGITAHKFEKHRSYSVQLSYSFML